MLRFSRSDGWIHNSRKNVENLSVGLVQDGVRNYVALTRANNPDWRVLVEPDLTDEIAVDDDMSDFEEDTTLKAFDPVELLPTSLDEVEAIKSMRFDPSVQLDAPSYLYRHADGTSKTYVRPEFTHLLEHSASSSFFAYIPVYFWRQVLHETNSYAVAYNVRTNPFTLSEQMTFLGILFYVAVNDKGEYANYWGLQAEDLVFGTVSTSLDSVMTLHRFKQLRRCFSFNATPTTLTQDAAARIRPLLNLLKITGGQYIHVGCDVALDEAGVACRSRQGRHMIVYNPMKPTGKYHFRLYMVCCSSSWIALNYKLHCSRSDVLDRLSGVVNQAEAQAPREELDKMSKIRQHVLEVTRPLFGTNRVVNMDNYYTYVQLLQELRLKGLYGRGTVRANSKHYPAHTILNKEDCSRCDYKKAVSSNHGMLAASWCDGNIVNIVSNADSTNGTTVKRMIGSEHREFSAPECVANYNNNMQGVDRLDQIRGRFSVADGNSYKRWHKKLALVLIDVAISNAYLTRRLIKLEPTTQDPHRKFVMELIGGLINGQWANAPSVGRMLYNGKPLQVGPIEQLESPSAFLPFPKSGLTGAGCTSISSRQMHGKQNRKRRWCIVCRWEGRYPTEVTNYCLKHNVCLCLEIHDAPAKPWMCPATTVTCWDRFHEFYYPNELFTAKGNLCRNSKLAQLKQASQSEGDQQTPSQASQYEDTRQPPARQIFPELNQSWARLRGEAHTNTGDSRQMDGCNQSENRLENGRSTESIALTEAII